MLTNDTKEEIIKKLISLGVCNISSLSEAKDFEPIKIALLKESEQIESYIFFIRVLAYVTSALTIVVVFLQMFKPSFGINLNNASLLVLWSISNIWVFMRYQTSGYRTKEKIFLIELIEKTKNAYGG